PACTACSPSRSRYASSVARGPLRCLTWSSAWSWATVACSPRPPPWSCRTACPGRWHRMERPPGGRHRTGRGCAMPKFMDVHDGFVGVTEDQLREAHERDLANEEAEGVHFERAWLDPDSGKVFCLSTGPSKDAVLRVHEKSGHPTAEIYELPVEV